MNHIIIKLLNSKLNFFAHPWARLRPFLKSLPLYWTLKLNINSKKYRQLAGFNSNSVLNNASNNSKNVLIFTSIALFADHALVDQYIAACCSVKGLNPIIVLCDEDLKICHASDRYSFLNSNSRIFLRLFQKRLCNKCKESAQLLKKYSNFKIINFSDCDIPSLHQYSPEVNNAINESANSGFVRFLATSDQNHVNSHSNKYIFKAYEASSHRTFDVVNYLLDLYNPKFVIAHHGIYVPQGLVQLACQEKHYTFYSWHFGYRKGTLIFSLNDTYHKELVQPIHEKYLMPLDSEKNKFILQYLKSRQSGSQDWIHFNRDPTKFKSNISKPILSCFTSVDWDAALHFPSSCFKSQFEFLANLVNIFHNLPHHILIIRIHPAEKTGFHPSYTKTSDFLKSLPLSPNIKIIDSNEKTSSYELANNSVATIVYNTKMAIELAAMKIPVIVAGDAWIKGKGFSFDVMNSSDLQSYVENFPSLEMTDRQHQMALAYAYYFYFNRCIDVPGLTPVGSKFGISLDHQKINLGFDSDNNLLRVVDDMIHSRSIHQSL